MKIELEAQDIQGIAERVLEALKPYLRWYQRKNDTGFSMVTEWAQKKAQPCRRLYSKAL